MSLAKCFVLTRKIFGLSPIVFLLLVLLAQSRQRPWRRGSEAVAINVLEGRPYRHHPVMLAAALPLRAFPLEKEYIVEINGLRVPAEFDCDIFNNGKHWGPHFYFYEVPSRWHACRIHHANMLSGLTLEVPSLPLVDDEYAEHVAVYHSVLRAINQVGNRFVVAELGARWGTWASRSVALLRSLAPEVPYSVYVVEADRGSCDGLRRVMRLNNISYDLDCNKANASKFTTEFLDTHKRVDLIDLDIQSGELGFLQETQEQIRLKVMRLIIGTHSVRIHQAIKTMFKDWILIHEAPKQTGKRCFEVGMKFLRGNYKPDSPDRFQWSRILEAGCYHNTSFGAVNQADGELILDNPDLVDRDNVFSMADKHLKI